MFRISTIPIRLVYRARRIWWRVARPKAEGVATIVLTASGKVVLVRHNYGHGWHLPGGGKKRGELPAVAALRELHEEIGLESFSSFKPVSSEVHQSIGRKILLHLFVLHDVKYVPVRSLEIAQIVEFDIAELPEDSRYAQECIDQYFSTAASNTRR